MEYKINDDFKIINDNSQNMLEHLNENSIDAIVCDPPYELGFMGKKWDGTGIAYDKEFWGKCFKVLKDGGYLLAFGGSRTFHRIACAIEDAGFEIRDCIMWLYGSGFPKSQNVGLMIDKRNGVESKVVGINKSVQDLKEVGKITGHKMTFGQEGTENCERKDVPILEAQNEWNGWGTCLKPAYEPIIMARKPFKGALIDNVLENGVGALNINECRVGNDGGTKKSDTNKCTESLGIYGNGLNGGGCESIDSGRFPANVITDGSEEVAQGMPNTKSTYNPNANHQETINRENADVLKYGYSKRVDSSSYNDEGSAMRYFYCAKASKKDRDEGVAKKNIHPTVKPTELMQYLVRLVSPKGATILDPFNGSGSTGKAVAFENRERDANYKYIGFELEKEYVDISIARINYALNKYEYDKEEERQEQVKKGAEQLSLF